MGTLFYNISQVLGITIIHSLWQGLIIYIALRLFVLGFPRMASAIKYRVAYASLTVMLGWFIYTLFKELAHYDWLSTTALKISPISLSAAMPSLNATANQYYFTIAGYLPYLTIIYIVGLVFNTLRLTLAWNSIYRIRQNIANAGFEGAVKRLSAKINLNKPVQAAFSEWVDVPCITGFIKPIILLPFSITCYLTTDEIEAILLHELAHIKRNDYLLNFIQQVIGILLFFNPFARLVNKLINEERENCCDDKVVQVTGSPFIYAQALLKLEENKQNEWQLALAATGKKYELLNRIERIMKTKNQTVNIRPVLITLLALTCSISSIAWLNPEIKDGKVGFKNKAAMQRIASAITSPAPEVHEITADIKPVVTQHKKKMAIKYYADSTHMTLRKDTVIKSKKYKIVVEDESGNKREYNSVNELPKEDRKFFYRNNVNTKFNYADSMQYVMKKYYSSDEWKKHQAELDAHMAELNKKFNSPEWKKHQAETDAHMAELDKKFNSPEWKKHQAEIDSHMAELNKKFNSPEWKKQQEEIAAHGEELAKKFNSPEWKKQQEEIAARGEELAKKFDSPEWRKQQEEYAKMGEEFGKKFINSPEWKKQQDAIVKQAMEIAKQADKMAEKADRSDLKVEQKAIARQAKKIAEEADKMSNKINKVEKKQLKVDKKERKEIPEKPEAPEKPEPAPKIDPQ
jgi:beta-lactamase regulating signal transducer with metallopeptidase domain